MEQSLDANTSAAPITLDVVRRTLFPDGTTTLPVFIEGRGFHMPEEVMSHLKSLGEHGDPFRNALQRVLITVGAL